MTRPPRRHLNVPSATLRHAITSVRTNTHSRPFRCASSVDASSSGPGTNTLFRRRDAPSVNTSGSVSGANTFSRRRNASSVDRSSSVPGANTLSRRRDASSVDMSSSVPGTNTLFRHGYASSVNTSGSITYSLPFRHRDASSVDATGSGTDAQASDNGSEPRTLVALSVPHCSKSRKAPTPSQLGFYQGAWYTILTSAKLSYRLGIHTDTGFPERNDTTLTDASNCLLEAVGNYEIEHPGTSVDEGIIVVMFHS
jgi:hypothetical protein